MGFGGRLGEWSTGDRMNDEKPEQVATAKSLADALAELKAAYFRAEQALRAYREGLDKELTDAVENTEADE